METGTMASEAGPSTATTPSVPPDPLAPDDPLPTPQLDTAGLILSLDEEGKERARVRGGVMSKLARVVLFSEKIPQGEQDHFSIVPLENFKSIPPDLTALHKIPQESRRQERVFRYKGPGDSKWDSYLFARCEDGLTKAEVNDALVPVRLAFQTFRKRFSIRASYFKCTRRFYDCMYDAYTYPMANEMYKLRKLRAADGRSQVLEAITCPSGLDVTDSDREEEERDENNNEESSQQSSSSGTAGTGVQDVTNGSGSGGEESDQEPEVPAPKPNPPSVLNTVQQLQHAAEQAMAEASSLEKERQAVEAHKEAATKRLQEQQKLAMAEAELMRIQLQLAGTIPPDLDDGAAGDKSSSDDSSSSSNSSDEDDMPTGPGGDKIPAKKAPTLRSSKGGGQAKGSSPDANAAKGKSGGRHQPKRSSGGTGAGGSGGEPPKKPSPGKKTPDDAVDSPSKKKKRRRTISSDSSLSPDDEQLNFGGRPLADLVNRSLRKKRKEEEKRKQAEIDAADALAYAAAAREAAEKAAEDMANEEARKKSEKAQRAASLKAAQAISAAAAAKRAKVAAAKAAEEEAAKAAQEAAATAAAQAAADAAAMPPPPAGGTPPPSPTPSSSAPLPADKRPGMSSGGSGGRKPKRRSKQQTRGSQPTVNPPGSTTAEPSVSGASTSSATPTPTDVDDEHYSSDEDIVEPSDKTGIQCSLGAHCKCENYTRREMRQMAVTQEQHMMYVYMERILKSCRDSVNSCKEVVYEVRKEVRSQGKQMNVVESAAKKAAEDKDIRDQLEEDASTLVLPWKRMDDAHYFMEDRERKAMVMRAIRNDVGGKDQTFVKKVMEHFFHGRLIGRIYRNQPRGTKAGGDPIIAHCQERFVLPPDFLSLLIQRLMELDVTEKSADEKIKVFFEGRRDVQKHMVRATLYRRESRDEVAYWCVVHEESKFKLLRSTAPFESFNSPQDKAEWLDQYREIIKQEYKRTFGRDPPERRTTEQGEEMARKEEEAISKRRRNYPGRLGD